MITLLPSAALLLLAVLSLIKSKFMLAVIFACSAAIISTLAMHINYAIEKALWRK